MKLDGSKESGYLTPLRLGIIIAVAIVFGVWWSSMDDSQIDLTLHVTVSAETLDRLEPGTCDLSTYEMKVETPGGYATNYRFGTGTRTADNGCAFTLTERIEPASRYEVTFIYKGGSWGPRVVEVDDAQREDGRVSVDVAW